MEKGGVGKIVSGRRRGMVEVKVHGISVDKGVCFQVFEDRVNSTDRVNSVRSCRLCICICMYKHDCALYMELGLSSYSMGGTGELWSTKDVCQEICRTLVIVPSSDLLNLFLPCC